METCAYRIVQEATTNAFKHAQAQRISIKLSLQGNNALIVVEDDGRGIDHTAVSDSHGIGLAAIHEGAELIGAEIEISTRVSLGTRLTLNIPLAYQINDLPLSHQVLPDEPTVGVPLGLFCVCPGCGFIDCLLRSRVENTAVYLEEDRGLSELPRNHRVR